MSRKEDLSDLCFPSKCAGRRINCAPRSCSQGDSLGKLRAHGAQALHGSRQGPPGRTGFVNFSDRLVQALPDLLDGGSHDGPAAAPVLPAFPGEHSGTLL